MRFSQFDHLQVEEAELYKAVSEIIARHFNVSEADAASFGEALISHGLLNPYQIFARSRDIAAMKRVSAALLEISRAVSDVSMGQRAQMTIHQSITFGPFFEKLMAEDDDIPTDEFREFMDKTGMPDSSALIRIECAADRFRQGIDAAIKHVESSPYARTSATKINTLAVGVVSASVFIWQIAGKKPPPRSLNEASPFATFLSEVFIAAGIDAQPVPAFNAWKNERKKVYTSQEKIEGTVDD